MSGAQEGLGFAIHDARNGLRADLLVVVMIMIGATGVLIDWFLQRLTLIPSVRWGYDR
jgi:NitT/TauT family transport system permease protein